ncbi:hypothetical protein MKEN_00214900 [Mycena kentingensis (nom. inval.)]|nr:hypothetical protein MKEN_00214900 [Mycena kentingensis (nom. inval.)]
MAHSSLALARPSRPTTYIHRACSNCRRRKTGCDGERPTCRRCRDHPPRNLAPCIYSYTPPSGVPPPEVSEDPEDPNLLLVQPYRQSPTSGALSPLAHSPSSSAAWTPSPVDTRAPLSDGFFRLSPGHRTTDTSAMLLETFLAHFRHNHFVFLDAEQLRAVNGVHSLASVILLWATHIRAPTAASGNSAYARAGEVDDVLSSAVAAIARDTTVIEIAHGNPNPNLHALCLIQASILLSLYFLDTAQFTQGRYHCAAATSLALSCGLHQLGAAPGMASAPFPPSFLRHGESSSLAHIHAPARESIDAFWAVVILNNYFVAVCGAPSSMPSDTMISTRWPTHQPPYAQAQDPAATNPNVNANTNDVAGHSPLTLLAKSSILLERTISLTNAMNYPGHAPNNADLWTLDRRLETFRELLVQLYPIHPPASPPGLQQQTENPTLVLTNLFINTAILQLHAPYAATSQISYRKCLAAAGFVAGLVGNIKTVPTDAPDVMYSPFLSAFAELFISYLPPGPLGTNAVSTFDTIVSALRATTPKRSALAARCLQTIEARLQVAQFQFSGAASPGATLEMELHEASGMAASAV